MTLTDLLKQMVHSHCDSLTIRFNPYAHAAPISGPYFSGESRSVFVDVVYGDTQFSTTFTVLDTILNPAITENELTDLLDRVRQLHHLQFEKGRQ